MIQIYDVNHVRKYLLENIEDYTIESTLNDKVLSFSVPFSLVEKNMIQEEEYIRTHTDEFVIKEIETNRDKLNIKAVLNLELLEGKSIINFNTSEQTAEDTINLAIAGTTWTCKINGNITKKRTVRKSNTSALEVLNDIKKTFILEFQYDTFNKVINVYEKVGSDKGTYLMEDLNLKSLNIQSDTHDFYTKIIAFGKKATDGTELKTEVTNNTFSNKVKELIWKDDRYTVLSDLQEDAQYKLDQLSKPKVSYKAEVIDLATLNPKYKDILSYGIGDIITLVSKTKAVREKQRIVKITEYPKEPYRNTCEIANTTANFEDIQKEQQDTNETVSNITSDNGTITREAIEHVIQDLVVNEVDANTIQAVNAKIANLEATKATITQLNAEAANIRTLVAGKAEVTNLEAANAKIGIIEADTAQIKTQISHFFSGESGQLIHLTAGNIVVDDGTFTSAMIKDLSASKLTAGTVNTTNIDVGSASGNLLIRDNTLQIKDDSNTVRVQIGKEGSGATADYSLSLWDSKGALIWDARGLTADGIQRAIIRNDMVADNANINAGKLDIGSLFDHINADGSHTLNSSKIHLDNENQTLDVAFNSLNTKVSDIKVGGRNLLLSNNIEQGNLSGGDGTLIGPEQNPTFYRVKEFIHVKPNTSYIVTINKFPTTAELEKMLEYNASGQAVKIVQINGLKQYKFTTNSDTALLKITFIMVEKLNPLNIVKDYEIKLEEGTLATSWTESPEDLEALVKAAHDAANVADAKAVAAKTAADTAQTAANNANSLLSDLSSDNKLTPIEKQETKKEVDIIKTEKPQIDANADKYSIDKSNYDTTYDTLISYIDPLLVDLSTTSDIVGNDFRNTFRTYYYYKQELLNQISTKAKTLADDADAKAVAADNKINNLKIGGTNLLRKFSKYREGNKYTVTASHDDNYVLTEGRVTLEADTDYILTFKTNATHTGNNGEDSIELWLDDSENNKYINMTGNTYKPIEKYYKFNSSTNNGEFIFRYDVNKNGTTYSIWDVKIEKGTKPTDWSPAPEDLEEVTTDIQTKLHVEQGRIDELIKNTTIVKSDGQVVQLKTEYNDTVSTVNTIKSDIASHKTQIDALSGKITGVETKANTLERDLESTKSTLTSTSAKINDLKIGGTNLYLDTKEYSNPNIWTWGQAPLESGKIDGFGYVRIKGNWGRRWQSVTAEPNTIYTMSAWIKRGDQETAPTLIGTYFTDKDNSSNDAVLISKTGYETDVPPELNKWIRISATFRTSSTSTKIFARFEPYVADFQNKNPDMSFYGLKLEKGNIATDWTPAPQDIETNLNDKVNNIQVGGTNLIRGSKLFILDNDHFKDYTSGRLTMSDDSGFKVATITATGSTSENWAALMSNGYPATHGDSFVFSFDFKTSDLSALDNKNIASFNFYDSTNNRIEQQDIHVPANVTESNKWYRLSFDYTCNNANVVLGSVQGHLAKNGSVSFKRMKVERGNKVTDWTPSPEDFDKDIANAKAAATAADTKASNANDKINNLKVGGRNYYKADSDLNAWNDTTVARNQTNARNGFIITYAGNAAGVMRIPKVINSNGQWTVSGYLFSTVADANVEVQIADVQAWNGHVNNTTWTYFEGTVDVKNYNDTVFNFVDIEGYHINGQVYVVDFKIEKGNKATDWSAAPEDMNKEIQVINTKTSAIEQNLTSITSTVTETTAHVGTLTTKVTANESSISQLSTSITSKVDAAGVISTVKQTPAAVEYSFNKISPTVQISSTGLDIKNKVGTSVFNVDANSGNVNMNIFDSHLKLSATGARSAAMWCDVHDLFHIQVPFTQENGGLKIETDTNVTLFEAIKTAANGQEVHLPTYTRIKSLTTEDFSNVGDMTTCHSYLRFFSDGDKKVHMKFNADDSGSGLIIETSRNKPIFEYTHHMDGSDEAIHCHMWLKTSDISTTGTIAITGDLWCSGRATGNAFSALSSSRYKKDIQDIDINVLNSVLSNNNIKHYKMIEDEHEDTRTGLILEDLTEDAKALLNLTNNEGIDLYSMTSILWSIVQDQQKQIQDLRNLITK